MSQPANSTTRDATIRADLMTALSEYDLSGNLDGMAGLAIAPVIQVNVYAERIKKYKIKQMAKKGDSRRAPSAGYNRIQRDFDFDTYVCSERGLEEVLDKSEVKMYGEDKARELRALALWNSIRGDINQDILDAVFGLPGSQQSSAAAVWSNHSAADPVADIKKGRLNFWKRTGRMPNAVAMDYEHWNNLTECQSVIDRITSTTNTKDARMVTRALVAQLFEVDEVIVNGAAFDAANEAQETDFQSAWDEGSAFLFLKSTNPNFKEVPRFANNMVWTGDTDGAGAEAMASLANNEGFIVETYEETARRGEVVRVRGQNDPKIWTEAFGELITGVLA
jgi:hypothetical protein